MNTEAGLAKDVKDTLDGATNQHFNRQRNTEADQAKYFMREMQSTVFEHVIRKEVGNLEKTFSSVRHQVKEEEEELRPVV